MPACYCESYGCNGKDVVPRTLESHHREDRKRNFRHAYDKATQVCNQQNDDITSYISSLTLSDDATGNTSGLGGRLWSRSVPDDGLSRNLSALTLSGDATGSDPDTPCSRSPTRRRHSPINNALSELANIEKEVRYLISVAGPQLKSLGDPSSLDDPFPLKAIISAAHSLRDRLSSFNNQALTVRETKVTISDRLSAFLEELMNANKSWNKKIKGFPKVEKTIPTYETSELVLSIIFSNSLIEFCSPPFRGYVAKCRPNYPGVVVYHGCAPSCPPSQSPRLPFPAFDASIHHTTFHDPQ